MGDLDVILYAISVRLYEKARRTAIAREELWRT